MSIELEREAPTQAGISDREQWLAVIASGLLAAIITAVSMPAEAATASLQLHRPTVPAEPAS